MVTGPTVMGCIERGDFTQCIGEAYFGAEPMVAEAGPEAEQQAIAVAEAAPEPEVEETAATVAPAVMPTFTVVRVEPDGSAIIAGSGSPSSEIRIFANGEVLGSETTETGGDFVHVTAEPLPSGGVELSLLDVASGEYATTSIVVIVQEDRTSEPLVVASNPGQASEILQGLEPEPEVVAETPPVEAVEDPVEPAIEDVPAVVEETLEVAQAETPVAEAPAPAPIAVQEPEPEPVVVEEPAPEPVVVEESAPEPAEEAAVPAEPVAQEAMVAEPVQEEEAPAPQLVIVPPTIDAVEIDGDRNFFAGGGTEGLAVRLYVDNRPVGTTRVADGRWLVEAINVLIAAAQRIRVDMLNADGSVAGRAEVDFVIELPEQEPVEEPVVVAEAPAVEPELAPEPEPAPEPAPQPEPEPVADEQPAPEPVPTMVGTTNGDRTTSGQVIIRRGDNLWTIARRVYGEGLRYTQIYEANTSQIRNPDLIYPGQVFALPGTDMVIGEEQ